MLLRELDWRSVQAYLERDDRLIFPIGSVEQHGPIGIFGTDYLVPEAIAAEVAERTETIAAPALCYGMSQHHMAFPGTMSLRPSTFIRVIRDILVSLARHGFQRILILNGHGGNIAPAQSAITETCHTHTDLKIKFFCWWEKEEIKAIIEEMFGEDEGSHGTPSEISQIMHIHPGIVRERDFPVQKKVERKYAVNYIRFRELFPDGSVNANSHLASGESGKKLFLACVDIYSKEMLHWD